MLCCRRHLLELRLIEDARKLAIVITDLRIVYDLFGSFMVVGGDCDRDLFLMVCFAVFGSAAAVGNALVLVGRLLLLVSSV